MEKFSTLLEDAAIRALQRCLTIDGRSITLEEYPDGRRRSSIEVKIWVSMFKEILLSCRSGSELYEKLTKYSEERRMGHERHFKEWHFRHPQIFDNLVHEFSHPKLPAECEKIYKELGERENRVIIGASRLKKKLEEKIVKIW